MGFALASLRNESTERRIVNGVKVGELPVLGILYWMKDETTPSEACSWGRKVTHTNLPINVGRMSRQPSLRASNVSVVTLMAEKARTCRDLTAPI